MSAENQDDLSRRSVLKQAAVGGVGLVAGTVLLGSGSERASAAIEQVTEKGSYLAKLASCVSGNRLLGPDSAEPVVTKAREIFLHRSAEEIADMTRNVIEKARGVEGLAVDFSGTHSRPDDPGLCISPALIFGSETMAEMVREQKQRVDPGNRFRFHPFAKFL